MIIRIKYVKPALTRVFTTHDCEVCGDPGQVPTLTPLNLAMGTCPYARTFDSRFWLWAMFLICSWKSISLKNVFENPLAFYRVLILIWIEYASSSKTNAGSF